MESRCDSRIWLPSLRWARLRAVHGGAGVGAGVHDARVEGAGAAAEGVEREGGGDVGGVGGDVGFAKREAEKREHALRAVQQRETFFGFERDGLDVGLAHGFGAGDDLPLPASPKRAWPSPMTTCARCASGARSPDAPTEPCDGITGMNFGVEHGAEGFDGFGADAAEAFGERVGAEKHHRAGFGFAERRADAAGVRANEIDLELADLFGGDADGGEFAEAGVDAVGGFAAPDDALDDGARGFHALDGVGCERDFGAVERDVVELREGEIVAGELDGWLRRGHVGTPVWIWNVRGEPERRDISAAAIWGGRCGRRRRAWCSRWRGAHCPRRGKSRRKISRCDCAIRRCACGRAGPDRSARVSRNGNALRRRRCKQSSSVSITL